MKVSIYGYIVEMPTDYKLRQNFTLKELANNSGDPTQPQFLIDKKSDLFMDMLQEFRIWYNKPITINSCYRQQKYNNSLKGADPKSAHTHACAADIAIKGHTEQQRQHMRDKWQDICDRRGIIGAINYYTNGYHIEIYSNDWYGSKVFQFRDYRNTKNDW